MMLTDQFHDIHMGVTAKNVASKYGVRCEEQDEVATEAQRRATIAARQLGPLTSRPKSQALRSSP